MRNRPRLIVATLAAVLFMAPGCTTGTTMVDGVELLPSATSADWATYADHVVKVRVESEGRVEPSPEELEAGEGIVGRTVVVATEDVLWSRPNTSEATPRAMNWSAGGWTFKGSEQKRTEKQLVQANSPQLVVGHNYLIAVAFTPMSLSGDGPGEWIPLGGAAMLPFDDGVVGRGEAISLSSGDKYSGKSGGDSTPMRDSLWGKSGEDVKATLDAMRPDPKAEKYWEKNPVLRYQAIRRENRAPQSPGPGERR